MSIQELESAVKELPRDQLGDFAHWFEEYLADQWEKQIAEDSKAGRLDQLIAEANQDFEAGKCREL